MVQQWADASRCVARVPRFLSWPGRSLSEKLRNDSGEITRAIDRGESFVVTRNGVAVGELVPLRRRRFVMAQAAVAAMSGAAPIDAERFRADIDALVDQDPTPGG
jgi:antitoxin (DNA-binding transcriptional repressor) of toxin-antitoxin stability system